MNQYNQFDIKTFCDLYDGDLTGYAESYLNSDSEKIHQKAVLALPSLLGVLDFAHLTYAIEFGQAYAAKEFAIYIPEYLIHEDLSVRCAASRFLENLPVQYIDTNLIKLMNEVLITFPVNQSFEKEQCLRIISDWSKQHVLDRIETHQAHIVE